MKKVIDGKLYDTEKATMIADYWNGLDSSDVHYVSEELYVTAKGNYFLFGEGGAMTEYSVSCGNNSWGGSANIISLTREEAYKWLENREQTEAIIEYFSDFIEEA